MNKRDSKTNVTLITLLLLSVAVRAQVAEPKGELRLYGRATQVGTVANREFKDGKGRVVKVIYYTGGGSSFQGPFREELLREQSISTYTYNDQGCRIRSEVFKPGMKLSRTDNVRCHDGTATPRLTTISDARGVKQAEIRHKANGSTQTELLFDSFGDKVVAINGEVPTDVDLLHGWGEELGGFACGIAANRERGRQEDLEVHVTIKNISHDAEGVVMISPVLVELKDITGRVVERKSAYRKDENKTQSEGCPTYMNQGAPFAGRSQPQTGYGLGEQYDRLAPGTYSITIAYCVSGERGLLVSNTILLEVEGHENR
jgi:hypothetical protein